jgi:hypothetical protein
MLKEVKKMDKQDRDEKAAELKAVENSYTDVTTKNSAAFDKAHRAQFPWPYVKVCYVMYVLNCLYLPFA